MDRKARLLGNIDRSQQIIELGPGYNPVAPKQDGWQTHVVDHATRAELRTKYAAANIDVNLIEDVDTIWSEGQLHNAVPADLLNCADVIIASHVLEHIPDLVGFLQSASKLAKSGGSLSVALPDRRYCFDCFRPATTTGALLEAHQRKLTRHSLKTAYDHLAYSATIDGHLAWGPRPVTKPQLMDPFEAAANLFSLADMHAAGPYRDYHSWQFTPAGFRLVVLELTALGISDWRITEMHGPENFEFFVTLRRINLAKMDPVSLQVERQRLLLAQLVETQEQLDFILGRSHYAADPTDQQATANKELASRDQSSPTGANVGLATPATMQADPAIGLQTALIAKIAEHDRRLDELSDTFAWQRTLLGPVQRIWRTLRGNGSSRKQQ